MPSAPQIPGPELIEQVLLGGGQIGHAVPLGQQRPVFEADHPKGRVIRQLLAQRHLHPQINFCLTAFAATTISGLLLQLPTFSNTPTIAMAASVLLLVPGFPLINAVADMFKGHINTGLARWAIASLLTLATCVGVVMALTIWGLRGWV